MIRIAALYALSCVDFDCSGSRARRGCASIRGQSQVRSDPLPKMDARGTIGHRECRTSRFRHSPCQMRAWRVSRMRSALRSRPQRDPRACDLWAAMRADGCLRVRIARLIAAMPRESRPLSLTIGLPASGRPAPLFLSVIARSRADLVGRESRGSRSPRAPGSCAGRRPRKAQKTRNRGNSGGASASPSCRPARRERHRPHHYRQHAG